MSPVSAHCPGFRCVLLTYFILLDIHTALGINSPLCLSLSCPGPSCSPPLAHSTCMDYASGKKLCAILCGQSDQNTHFRLNICRHRRTIHSLPKMKCEEEVREQRGQSPLWVSFLDIKTNTTEEIALMYYQGEKFQQQAECLYIIGHYHKALLHFFIF